jgi:hypothetical protein
MTDQQPAKFFPFAIAQYLRTLIDCQKGLEAQKVGLLENHLFNPYVAFQYFDRFGQGYATKADIRSFFMKNSVNVTDQDIDYLLFMKGRASEFSVALTRPDCMYYDNFLNLLAPADSKKLSDNLSSHIDYTAGKAQLLPDYVFSQFIEYLVQELKTFSGIQTLRKEMIKVYGYTAQPAFKLISVDDVNVTYFELKMFLEKHQEPLTLDEFFLLTGLIGQPSRDSMTKSGFLNLFTPFDKNIHYQIGDRRYESLSKQENSGMLIDYLNNAYLVSQPQQKFEFEDPRLKEVSHIMQNLYSNQGNFDSMTSKNLYINHSGKVMFDISKKQFPYHSISTFNDHFDQYHKELYKSSKAETHELLLKEPLDLLRHQAKQVAPTKITEVPPSRGKHGDMGKPKTEPIPPHAASSAIDIKLLKGFMRHIQPPTSLAKS